MKLPFVKINMVYTHSSKIDLKKLYRNWRMAEEEEGDEFVEHDDDAAGNLMVGFSISDKKRELNLLCFPHRSEDLELLFNFSDLNKCKKKIKLIDAI